MADSYLTAKITAWAIIDGIEFTDVISVSATFALNSIPTASVVLAVGKRAEGFDEMKPATIHEYRQFLKPRAPATVYVKISNVAGDVGQQAAIKEGTYKVFDGYLAGIGYQRSHNHANYVVNLVHWLDDLNNSSAINGNWFPGVPHDYAQQAVADLIMENADPTGTAITPAFSAEFAQPSKITSDLWGNTIKPMLKAIGGFSSGEYQKQAGDGTVIGSNDAANKALDKMPGEGPYAELGLKLEESSADNVSDSIAQFFSQSIGQSFVQNTMWSKIINEYAAQFMFSISPAVDWALPIPFCAGLKFGGNAKKITAKEYNYANFNANMSQLIEGVYVHYPSACVVNTPNNAAPNNVRLSFYKPWANYPPNPQKGLKLFKLPPAWLANLDGGPLNTLASQRAVQDFTGEERGGGKEGAAGIDDPATAYNNQRSTAERFAQHWYYTEVLQQRYGELAGPLRFDIAPGSIIKVETPPRDEELGDKNHFVVASVISVSYVINAERATAGTSFTIAHIKTAQEHDDPSKLYSTAEPPLYKKPWHSGPLTGRNKG